MIDLPQFTLFDIIFGFGLFCVFCLVLLAGFLASGAIKWIIFSLCAILFFALPFLNILIIDSFIRKADFIDDGSKKLVYIDSFLLRGILQNNGRVPLKKCDFNIYTTNKYPLKPNFKLTSEVNLGIGKKIAVEETIDNIGESEVKRVKIRCF